MGLKSNLRALVSWRSAAAGVSGLAICLAALNTPAQPGPVLTPSSLGQTVPKSPLEPFVPSPEYQAAVQKHRELLNILLDNGTINIEGDYSSEMLPTERTFEMAPEDTQPPARRRARAGNLKTLLAQIEPLKPGQLIKLQSSTKWIRAGATDSSPCKFTVVLWLEAPRKVYILQEVASKDLFSRQGPWRVVLNRHVTIPLELLEPLYGALSEFEDWNSALAKEAVRARQSAVLKTNGLDVAFSASMRGNRLVSSLCRVRDEDAGSAKSGLDLSRSEIEELLQHLESLPAALEAGLKNPTKP